MENGELKKCSCVGCEDDRQSEFQRLYRSGQLVLHNKQTGSSKSQSTGILVGSILTNIVWLIFLFLR